MRKLLILNCRIGCFSGARIPDEEETQDAGRPGTVACSVGCRPNWSRTRLVRRYYKQRQDLDMNGWLVVGAYERRSRARRDCPLWPELLSWSRRAGGEAKLPPRGWRKLEGPPLARSP